MGNRTIVGCFLGVVALITYRDFKSPDDSWPLGPVAPPYRFTYACVAFGILAIVGDVLSEKVASVVAVGVLVGVIYSVIGGTSTSAAGTSNAASYVKSANPDANNGITGSTSTGGSYAT